MLNINKHGNTDYGKSRKALQLFLYYDTILFLSYYTYLAVSVSNFEMLI